jgi:hypothetical protein
MMKQIYIPTAPGDNCQNEVAIGLQKPLVKEGYSPGLMLVILGGRKGLENSREHYSKLERFGSIIQDWSFVTMLGCTPCEELDLLNEPEFGLAHIKEGIDYTAKIPFDTGKKLTFHLGSLVTQEEFLRLSKEEWQERFYKIVVPSLKEVAKYGNAKGVEIKVETTPVPEFGDLPDEDSRTYRGERLNQLRNPVYLTHLWGFEQIKESGLGICLDICHSRTIYDSVRLGVSEGILFSEDIGQLADVSLMDDVVALDPTDLVHLNDGRGIYSSAEKTVFEEGVTLGEGEIEDLGEIISLIENRGIPYVLEINETDFVTRPNTKKSVDYLLQRKNYKNKGIER